MKELINKYYNSNDLKEKESLKLELFKIKQNLKLPISFEIAVLGHFDMFKLSGKKSFLNEMLEFTT